MCIVCKKLQADIKKIKERVRFLNGVKIDNKVVRTLFEDRSTDTGVLYL